MSNGLSAFPMPKRFFVTMYFAYVSNSGGVMDVARNLLDGFERRYPGEFFVLRPSIFDYMNEGEELVEAPFQRLAAEGRLLAYAHDGFWACMDTFREKQLLEDMYSRGQVPWEVWKTRVGARRPPRAERSAPQRAEVATP